MAQNVESYEAQKFPMKWEDRAAVAHHCGVCKTGLSSAKSKRTCLGKHVEPCARYHQHLFFIGKSHVCMACTNADKTHHDRHRYIADVLKQYTEREENESEQERRAQDPSASLVPTSTPGKRPGTRKERKAEQKVAKARSRAQNVVTAEDIQHVSNIIHPPPRSTQEHEAEIGGPLVTLRVRAAMEARHAFFHGVGTTKASIPADGNVNIHDKIVCIETGMIMRALMIPVPGKTTSKQLTGLANNIYDRITEDLIQAKKEDAEMEKRKVAFLRYAGRKNFEASTEREDDWSPVADLGGDHEDGDGAVVCGAERVVDELEDNGEEEICSPLHSHPIGEAEKRMLEAIEHAAVGVVTPQACGGAQDTETPNAKPRKAKAKAQELPIDTGRGFVSEDRTVVWHRRAQRNARKRAERKARFMITRERPTANEGFLQQPRDTAANADESLEEEEDEEEEEDDEDDDDEDPEDYTVIAPELLFTGWFSEDQAKQCRTMMDEHNCLHGAYVLSKDQYLEIYHAMNLSLRQMTKTPTCGCSDQKLEDTLESGDTNSMWADMANRLYESDKRVQVLEAVLEAKTKEVVKLRMEAVELREELKAKKLVTGEAALEGGPAT